VQLEILKLSEGDGSQIDYLVDKALVGFFSVYICTGLKSCPCIPDQCRDKVLKIIKQFESQESIVSFTEN
jgi:hypothetical protein